MWIHEAQRRWSTEVSVFLLQYFLHLDVFSYSPEIVQPKEKIYRDYLGSGIRYECTETLTVSQNKRLTASSVAQETFVDLGLICFASD